MVRISAKHLSAPEVLLVPIGAKPYRVALISTKPAPDIETDLLGDALLLERKNAKPEAAALKEILLALTAHPAVAWCERMNSGAVRIGKRFVRFGWKGCLTCWGNSRTGDCWAWK